MIRKIDIGANLTDPVFRGFYNEKKAHEDDLKLVVERAKSCGVEKIMITAGSLSEAKEALNIALNDPDLFITVGVHPTRSQQMQDNPENYIEQLGNLIKEAGNKVVAFGEFGLDYDRLHFSPKEAQLFAFERQFILAESTGLPLFLHSRNCEDDFLRIIKNNRGRFKDGVVHSFTGSLKEMRDYIECGLYIGLNGCSFKTEENINVVREIPSDRIMIETDSPYCEVRKEGLKFIKTPIPPSVKKEKWRPGALVKGRNEPCYMVQVLDVLAGIKGISDENFNAFGETIYQNTKRVFFPNYP